MIRFAHNLSKTFATAVDALRRPLQESDPDVYKIIIG